MTRRPGERGSMAVEFAMIAPIMMLLLGLVFVYGRVTQVSGTLESGTRDGARAASRSRTQQIAEQEARQAVRTGMQQAPTACQNGLDIDVLGRFEPGEAITVVATCSYPLSDLLPGAPGSMRARSEFTSFYDYYRGFN